MAGQLATRMPEHAPLPSLRRLNRGRHGLSREQVAESQRQRIVVGMLYAVAEHGYTATTVADVVARAGVSRTSFYAQFADKQACFLAAYDHALSHVAAELIDSDQQLPPDAPWRLRLESDTAAYLDVLASEPALALTLHQEALAVGTAALDHRARLLAMLAERTVSLNQLARSQEATLPEVPAEVFALYTGGLDELIRDRLRTNGPEALRDLTAPLVRATIALFGA
jgi:AcrR family transcriptional regulator